MKIEYVVSNDQAWWEFRVGGACVARANLPPDASAPEVRRAFSRTLLDMIQAAPVAGETGETSGPSRPIGHLVDALKRAYADVGRARHVLQRAGVDVAQINSSQSPAGFWRDALHLVRGTRQIDAIVGVATADPSVRAHWSAIRAAAERTS